MSVIVAKHSPRHSSAIVVTETHCFPAVTAMEVLSIGETATIDAVSLVDFCAVKWYVTLCDDVLSLVQTFEVFATAEGSVPYHVRYGMIGDRILSDVTVDLATTLNLKITNNDVDPITVYVTRVAIPRSLSATVPTNTVPTTINRSVVLASSTNSIDFFDESIAGVKWLVTVMSVSGSQSTFQVIANSKFANMYAITGDATVYDIGLSDIPGFGTELTLTNNGLSPVKVIVSRVPIQITNTDIDRCSTPTISWAPTSVTVPAGSSLPVDGNIVVPNHTGAKWLVCVNQPATAKTMALEVFSTLTTTDTNDLPYARTASLIDVTFSSTSSAGTAALVAHNNTPEPVTVNLLRVPIGL